MSFSIDCSFCQKVWGKTERECLLLSGPQKMVLSPNLLQGFYLEKGQAEIIDNSLAFFAIFWANLTIFASFGVRI